MPIWLTLILALPQIIKFVKEIYDLWKQLKTVPDENKKAATADFKDTLTCMKVAKDDATKEGLLKRFRERLEDHKHV